MTNNDDAETQDLRHARTSPVRTCLLTGMRGDNVMSRAKSTRLYCIIYLIVIGLFSAARAESELKDTPYFSGMPNYKIDDATDQGFADYRFFNGKDCTTVVGEKNYRAFR
jgi:hypothetical protein